jgi:ligand-binding sensor domain-containing protein
LTPVNARLGLVLGLNTRMRSGRVAKAMLAAGLVAAAMLTAGPLVSRGLLPVAEARTAAEGPLPEGGGWFTHANGDRINRILRDGATAWVATDGGGLVRWDLTEPVTPTYRQYLAPQDGLLSNQVYDVEIAPDGVLWAATGRGLARMRPGGEGFDTLSPDNSTGMPARMVTAIEPTADGYLWVGFSQEWDPNLLNPKSRQNGDFRGGGMARYHPSTNTWEEAIRPKPEQTSDGDVYKSLPSENITEIEMSSDALLWIGSRPYYVWDENGCGDPDCIADPGYWLWAGGGLAVFDGSKWQVYRSTQGGGCYSDHIFDIEADAEGRMWVGTRGRGLLLMMFGMRKVACSSGQAFYLRGRAAPNQPRTGLTATTVRAVDIDAEGRVWIGQSEGDNEGKGITILSHNFTFGDSSAVDEGSRSDDNWAYIDFDDIPGDTSALVTALEVGGPDKLIGTEDNKFGGGFGMRAYVEAASTWTAMRTGDIGLPSNQITDIAHNPAKGETWVAFRDKGVARFDGERWQGWRMFGQGAKAATITEQARAGVERIKVNVPDQAAFNKLFPVVPAFARIENDPSFYRVTGYTAERNGIGPFLKISPKLVRPVASGTSVYLIYRGPPSDHSTQLAIGADGHVWAGGRETIWTGSYCSSAKLKKAQCWLDGGLGHWDGQEWTVFDVDNSQLPDQDVSAVAVDKTGRVWAGTGDTKSSGYGIAIYDPTAKTWTRFERGSLPSGQKMGSNGITDLSLDPQTGAMWSSHHPVVEYRQDLGGNYSRIFIGGGVSLWNTSAWSAWTKQAGARLRAFGEYGETTAVLADRTHNRIWVGAWDGEANFHWPEGYGVHAVVNSCPLDNCANGTWESTTFKEDGLVSDIDLDRAGNVWVGTHRNGSGVIPPTGGVKVFDGGEWSTYTPGNTPMTSNQITALAAVDARMWVGTLDDGISVFDAEPAVPPTDVPPSPTPSLTPGGDPTATPTDTVDETPTPGSPTATAGTPSGTASRTPTHTPGTPTDTPTASPTRAPSCGPGTDRPCRIVLPYVRAVRTCPGLRRCPVATSLPTPELLTAVPGEPTIEPTSTPSPEPVETEVPTDTPTNAPTQTGGPTDIPTATDTPVPGEDTATPTATASATATSAMATTGPTATRTRTPTVAPTATSAAPKQWSIFTPTDFRLPTDDFYGVAGARADDVWFVGATGKILHWDGTEMTSATAPSNKALRWISMLSATQGFIAGDEGALIELRSRRWVKANTGSYTDNWRAVAAVQDTEGLTGWALGGDKGNRIKLTAGVWAPGGPVDRNTGHVYSGIAMLSPSSAFATQNSANGARIYKWNGSEWSPGPSTGPLNDLHVRSTTEGVAVGARGAAWALDTAGDWKVMTTKPSTSGNDLNAVFMVAPDHIWAGGGATKLFRYNGATWVADDIRAQNRAIHDIWIAPDGSEGWAVGEAGLFLRYE